MITEPDANASAEQPPVDVAAAQRETGGNLASMVNGFSDALAAATTAKSSGNMSLHNQIVSDMARLAEANKGAISAVANMPLDDTAPQSLKLTVRRVQDVARSGGLPGTAMATDEDFMSPAAVNRIAAINNSSVTTAKMLARRSAGQTSYFEDEIHDKASTLAESRNGTFRDYSGVADDYVQFASKWGVEFGRMYEGQPSNPIQRRALVGAVHQAYAAGDTATERNEALMGILRADKLGDTPERKSAMLTAAVRGLEIASSAGEVDKNGNTIPGTSFSSLAGTGAGGMIIESLTKQVRKDGLTDNAVQYFTAKSASAFTELVRGKEYLKPEQLRVIAEIAVYQTLPPMSRAGVMSPRAVNYNDVDNATRWASQRIVQDKGNDGSAAAAVPQLVSAVSSVFQEMALYDMKMPEGVTYNDAIRAAALGDQDVLEKFSPEVQTRIGEMQKMGMQQASQAIAFQYGLDRESADNAALQVTLGSNAAALGNIDILKQELANMDPTGNLAFSGHIPGKNAPAGERVNTGGPMTDTAVAAFSAKLAGLSPTGKPWVITGDEAKDAKIRAKLLQNQKEHAELATPVSPQQQQVRDVEMPKVSEALRNNAEFMALGTAYVQANSIGDEPGKARAEKRRNALVKETFAKLYPEYARLGSASEIQWTPPKGTLGRSLTTLVGKEAELPTGKFGDDAISAVKDQWLVLEAERKLRFGDGAEVRANKDKLEQDAAFARDVYAEIKKRTEAVERSNNERIARSGLNPVTVKATAAKVAEAVKGQSLNQMRDFVIARLSEKAMDPKLLPDEQVRYYDTIRSIEKTTDVNLIAAKMLNLRAGLAAADQSEQMALFNAQADRKLADKKVMATAGMPAAAEDEETAEDAAAKEGAGKAKTE